MSRRGFTLVELLAVIVMIAVGLMAVLEGISYATRMLGKTRSEVVAINLAREGMEAVYAIRDTSRLRRSGEKDANWLNTDPMTQTSDWMQKDASYIIARDTSGARKLEKQSVSFETTDGYDDAYMLHLQNGAYGATGADTSYYRVITGKGLYNKQTGNEITNCTEGSDVGCDSDAAKEFRFCSRVVYDAGIGSDVELCGLITNFEE